MTHGEKTVKICTTQNNVELVCICLVVLFKEKYKWFDSVNSGRIKRVER